MMSSSIDDARTSYEAGGYCFSPPFLEEDEVSAAAAAAHDVLDGRYQTGFPPVYRNWEPGAPQPSVVKVDNLHVCSDVLLRTISLPAIEDWIGEVVGAPFLQIWSTELFFKPSHTALCGKSTGVIGWHQDAYFWTGWSGPTLTAWLRHTIRGGGDKDWNEVVAELKAGALSLHDGFTLHASRPNTSTKPRLGVAIHLRTDRSRLVPTVDAFRVPNLDDPRECPIVRQQEARPG